MDEHASRDRRELLQLDVEPIADVIRVSLDKHVAAAELAPFDTR